MTNMLSPYMKFFNVFCVSQRLSVLDSVVLHAMFHHQYTWRAPKFSRDITMNI